MKRYRKILCAVLALAMLLPAAVWAVQRLPHLSLTVGAGSVAAGEPFTVEVPCRAMEVCSYTGGFSFDTALLEVVSVTKGDAPVYGGAMVSGVSTAEEANQSGKVGCYAVHPEEGNYAGGTLMTVTFRAKAAGTAELRPYEDVDGKEAFLGLTGETYVVLTAAEGTVPVGDVNGSGVTDVVDMQSLFTYLSTGEKESALDGEAFAAAADLNGDDVINILDYQALYELVRGVPRTDVPDGTGEEPTLSGEAPPVVAAELATPGDLTPLEVPEVPEETAADTAAETAEESRPEEEQET